MPKILLVDDEALIADSLAFDLQKAGFEVAVARDARQALDLFQAAQPDLVVLDVRLPDMDGFEVCRRIRAASTAPVIMLTAVSGEADRVTGLDSGADDYIAKPFSVSELLARIRSVLRRVEMDRRGAHSALLQAGCLRVDLAGRRAFKGGQELHFSAREFDLLAALMSRAGQAVPRGELIAEAWGPGWHGDPQTLEVHIRWLRVKIEDDPSSPRFIQTVRGVGYRFAAPDDLP